jgi:putative hydrolase of the HAD superfamily
MLTRNPDASWDLRPPGINSQDKYRVTDKAHPFAHIESWIFDLDDTLYLAAIGLNRQMRDRAVPFLADLMNSVLATASKVHRHYYKRYGATL